MAVANRNLNPGDRFVATYKKQGFECVVDQTDPLAIRMTAPPLGGPTGNVMFKSLSAAGSAVMGGIACNGWRFWTPKAEKPGEFMAEVQRNTMAGSEARTIPDHGLGRATGRVNRFPATDEARCDTEGCMLVEGHAGEHGQEPTPATTLPNTPAGAKAAPKPRAFRLIIRVPNQKGVEPGLVRFFCRACMDGFLVPAEAGVPTVCANGHRSDDAELTSPTTATA